MRKKLLFILLIVFLWTIDCGLWTVSAEEQTVILDVVVTNPSDEEAQDVEVKADLPQELKKENIVSSDGLEVGFDTEKGLLFVTGKVLLQSAETTYYKITVRDVWKIPEEEVSVVRSALGALHFETQDAQRKAQDAISRLDEILARQRESTGDAGARIAAYRENKKEFSSVKEELEAARSSLHAVRRKEQRIIWLAVLAAILGAGIFIGRRRLILWIRGYTQKIKARTKIKKNKTEGTYVIKEQDKLQKAEDPIRNQKTISNGAGRKQTAEIMNEELKVKNEKIESDIPKVNLKEITVEPEIIEKVPAKFTWHYKFMPVKLEKNVLTVACANPSGVLRDDLSQFLGFKIKMVLADEVNILEAIKKFYGVGVETVEKILEEESASASTLQAAGLEEIKEEDIAKLAEEPGVIALVNQILVEAQEKNATDIHIEPYPGKLKLRYRIDGVLYDVRVPANIARFLPAIISRVKIMSGLNIVERRLPQDGRAKVKIKNEVFDLRISTMPTPYGESIVIRILPTTMLFSLEKLGFSDRDLKIFEELIKKPHGIIFVTGPTGSGKTTTLYTALSKIKQENKGAKILTIEDPIEYELEGITQIQVKPEINLTFARGLRSMLRHDPDIMMVGEVRDFETAEIAIRMALTGHLLFSTLHTNNAASGVIRLLDMGVESYLLASSVEAFIAQRLVRIVCEKCKGKGCQACNLTGYRGRTAIFELLLVNEEIKKLITQKAPADQIKKKAISQGMKTLWEDGQEKIKQGITTVEEVLRVTQEKD